MTQITYKAHKLQAAGPIKLAETLCGRQIPVEFNDGTIYMTATEIVLSSYGWNILHRVGLQPMSNHSIVNHYKCEALRPDSFNKYYNVLLWYAVDALDLDGKPEQISNVKKIIVEENNNAYNHLLSITSEHVVTIDIMDYVSLSRDPHLLELREKSNSEGNTLESVDTAFKLAEEYISSNIELSKTSSLAWHCRHGLIKVGQVLQGCFMRGYVHDIDRARIDSPITTNLTEGLDLTQHSLLSREASIAMAAGNGDIQQVTVDGRQMSYIGCSKSNIVMGDCCSTEYLSWKVSVTDGDALVGMWYKPTPDSEERIYTKEDAISLEGKFIQRRSPLTCKLTNSRHVCSKCYGLSSQAIPELRNCGITIAKAIAQIFAQLTLSTKHYVANMGVGTHKLDSTTAMYFRKKDDAMYFKKMQGVKKLELVFKIQDLHDIQSVFNVENVKSIPMARITHISHGAIIVTKAQTQVTDVISVGVGKNKSMLSYNMAEYIQRNKDRMTARGDEYYIDVTEYNKDLPVLIQTPVMENFRDVSGQIMATLTRSAKQSKKGTYDKSYGIMDTVVWLVENTANRYGISAAVIELLLSAYITESDTYVLARGLGAAKHRKVHELIRNRTASTAFMFDRAADTLTKASSLLPVGRTNGPLDVMVLPNEVIKK